MNGFFEWTFNVRRSGKDRRKPAAELPGGAAEKEPSRPAEPGLPQTEQDKSDAERFSASRKTAETAPGAGHREFPAGTGETEPPETSRTLAGIGTIADCAKKQVRFLRRMNDLLKAGAEGSYYL